MCVCVVQINVADDESEDQAVRRYMRAVVQSGVLNKVSEGVEGWLVGGRAHTSKNRHMCLRSSMWWWWWWWRHNTSGLYLHRVCPATPRLSVVHHTPEACGVLWCAQPLLGRRVYNKSSTDRHPCSMWRAKTNAQQQQSVSSIDINVSI